MTPFKMKKAELQHEFMNAHAEIKSLREQIMHLKTDIIRERHTQDKLLDIMRMGAQEGNFPRRANNG